MSNTNSSLALKRRVFLEVIYNLAGCDFGCHQWLDGNPLEKVEFFLNRLGQVKFDLLNSRARITFPRPDKKMLTIYYQQEIKKLENTT